MNKDILNFSFLCHHHHLDHHLSHVPCILPRSLRQLTAWLDVCVGQITTESGRRLGQLRRGFDWTRHFVIWGEGGLKWLKIAWYNYCLVLCCEFRFGTSVGGGLLAALLCWPNQWVVLIGALASSVGAALQCLTSMHFTPFTFPNCLRTD